MRGCLQWSNGVGLRVGASVGMLGDREGLADGALDGIDGDTDGDPVGASDGLAVGLALGLALGASVEQNPLLGGTLAAQVVPPKGAGELHSLAPRQSLSAQHRQSALCAPF